MIKRLIPLLLVLALVSACVPGLPVGDSTSIPAEDLAGTLAAQTVQALPSPTLEAPTETPTPVLPSPPTATATVVPATPTETQTPDIGTGTPGTATATATSGGTVDPASGPIEIDKLPPGTDYGKITLQNKSKTEVYVSLQCTTFRGYQSIMEQFVTRGSSTIKAPLGNYVYVAYVGGKKKVGSFVLKNPDHLTITFTRSEINIH
jgi:hypothetical protein